MTQDARSTLGPGPNGQNLKKAGNWILALMVAGGGGGGGGRLFKGIIFSSWLKKHSGRNSSPFFAIR